MPKKSSRSFANRRKKWRLQSKALAANAAELTHLEPKRARFDELQFTADDLTAEQASLTARKQEVSKRLAEVIKEESALSAFLDAGVKQHYGNRAEKLAEFGLQPLRRRRPQPTEPEEPLPEQVSQEK